ncbi:dioxygenase family protein [Ahniella affigens]|nr:class III extradiol ring-cleavage dioxygenase [Ahniella affigens]
MIRSVFLSHGAPLLALNPGAYADAFKQLGAQIKDAPCLIVVSPHWMQRGVVIGQGGRYHAIHDFGGFPEALYQLRHEIAGDPARSEAFQQALVKLGVPARLELRTGVDHGVWMPHRMMQLPRDQVIVPVAMPAGLDAATAWQFGEVLATAMPDAVVLGSGGFTHNLYAFRGQPQASPIDPRVQTFADWLDAAVLAGHGESLIHYRRRAPEAEYCHPTDEHLLPLQIAAGAAHAARAEKITREIDGITHGILSMRAYSFANA